MCADDWIGVRMRNEEFQIRIGYDINCIDLRVKRKGENSKLCSACYVLTLSQ